MRPEASSAEQTASTSLPPSDIQSEAAVLASIMIRGAGQEVDQVATFLRPEHFYSEAHRRMYEACIDLHRNGKPVDVVMVGGWLRDRDRIKQVGGMPYLTDVLNAVPHIDRIGDYAQSVFGKWRLREAIRTCQRIAAEGYVESGDTQEFLDRAESAIHDVARSHTVVAFETAKVVGDRVLRNLTKRASAGKTIAGRAMGFPGLDEKVSGLGEGTLTIIAARPGCGKTLVGLNMASHMATPRGEEQPPHVGFFCAEMENDELGARLLSTAALVDQSRIYNVQHLNHQDWSQLVASVGDVAKQNLHLCDDPNINVFAIRAMARRLRSDVEMAGGKLVAIFVDYLQLIETIDKKKGENREQEVNKMARDLKKLAKEMKIPIVAMAQLNRETEKAGSTPRKPRLSDLRESGGIEMHANNVFLIHHEMEKRKNGDDGGEGEQKIASSEIIVAKARNGQKGSVPMKFDGAHMRFIDISEVAKKQRDDEWAKSQAALAAAEKREVAPVVPAAPQDDSPDYDDREDDYDNRYF